MMRGNCRDYFDLNQQSALQSRQVADTLRRSSIAQLSGVFVEVE
jgi:hypothetical protein